MQSYVWSTLSLNVFSTIVLVMILFRVPRSGYTLDRLLGLFLWMVLGTLVLLTLDSVFWIVDAQEDLRTLNWVVNMFYFGFQPMIPWLWMVYVLEHIFDGVGVFRRRLFLTFIPLIGYLAVLVSTPWTGWLFDIDALGVYERGSGFWLAFLLPFGYLFGGFVILGIFIKRLPGRIRKLLFGFGLFPMFAGLAQGVIYGIAVLWPGVTLSMLFIYLWVEGEMTAADYLTGLQNRRSLHRYLERRVKDAKVGSNLGVLLLDLNDFKSINDTWGHHAGDEALKTLARVLRSCFHHHDFLARYGGDEFVVVLDVQSQEALTLATQRLQDQLARVNNQGSNPWKLSVSIGAALGEPGLLEGSDPGATLLDVADRAMYVEKTARHERERERK